MVPSDHSLSEENEQAGCAPATVALAPARQSGEAMRRARILASMRLLVAERTFHGVTRTRLCRQASVSSRSLSSLFGDTQGCFAAVIDEDTEHLCSVLRHGSHGSGAWRATLRGALTSLLVYLDREPMLARLWLVETLAAGVWAIERREQKLAGLLERIAAASALAGVESSALVLEATVAGVLGVLQARALIEDPTPRVSLLGELLGTVTRPYLERSEVRAEMAAGERLARVILTGERTWPLPPRPWDVTDLPPQLLNPAAHRARACLQFLAQHAGASNRRVAAGAGVAHQSQICLLLAELEAAGLVFKCPGAPGHAHAWSLTMRGAEVAAQLAVSAPAGDTVPSPPGRPEVLPRHATG